MRPPDTNYTGHALNPPGPPAGPGPLATTAASPLVPRPWPAGAGLPARPLPALASPSFAMVLKVLRRHWLMALAVSLLTAAVFGGAGFVLIPAEYRVTVMLHVATDAPNLLSSEALRANTTTVEYRNYQKTQEAVLASSRVLGAALKREIPEKPGRKIAQLPLLRAHGDPIGWLQGKLEIESEGEAITVSLCNKDAAEELKLIVEAITNAYLEQIVNREAEARRERLKNLRDALEEYKTALKGKRDQLKALADQIGSNDKSTLTLKQQLQLQQLNVLETELTRVRANLKKAQAEYAVYGPAEQAVGADVPDAVVMKAVNSDPQVQTLLADIQKMEGAIASHRRITKNGSDPALQKFRHELNAKRQALARYRQELKPVYLTQLREEARSNSTSNSQEALKQIQILQKYERDLTQDYDKLQDANKNLFQRSADVEQIKDEIEATEEAAKAVAKDMEALQVELRAPARVSVLSPPEVPETKEIKKQLIATIGLGVMGLVLGLFLVAWWQVRAGRIASVDEVTENLGLPVVGALPALPSRSRRALEGPIGSDEVIWRSQLTESVNAMRTMLLRLSRDEPLQIVLVTSALGGEGKTTLSSHLATSLARAGRRTLLIDGDLRKASLHKVFDLPAEPGLAELLRGEAEVADTIRPTLVDRLWLVPAGRCDDLALQALGMPEIRATFDRLRGQYDFIIVDSAPVLPVADSLLLSQNVDGVVFSILGDVSRVPRVYGAYERLAALGVRLLGAVVIGTKSPGHHREYAAYPTTPAPR
jgi:succinoglycan biosynthesis transport protein ExoP